MKGKMKVKTTQEKIQYHIDTASEIGAIFWVMDKLNNNRPIPITPRSKIKFEGKVSIMLDFENEIENYYIYDAKLTS